MRKYLTVFTISWQNEFTYRLNFILWRFRNVLRFLMTFFLWKGIFVTNKAVFGYSQPEMLTYVFLVLVVQSIVLSAPSADNIGGEISSGDLSNYLVKPVSYLKYWFTRDLSSKLLNIFFAVGEIGLLWLWLQPQIKLPSSVVVWLGFLGFCVVALGLYYFINVASKFAAFWVPENTWGLTFVTLVLIEILGGSIFPLDVLPNWANSLIQFTPFPYLVYYPVAIFVGRINGVEMLRILMQALAWLVAMFFVAKFVWRKGLMVYSSEGR